MLLLQGVRAIALIADEQAPATVSQRAFDSARSQRDEFADFPRAKRIAEQLQMPWREILAFAQQPATTHNHRLSRAQPATEQDWLTREHIAFALKLIETRLEATTVSPGEYRTEREKMLAEDSRAWRHGRTLRLPSENQIRSVVDGWDEALALAGLEPRAASTPEDLGLSTVALLDRCFAAHGAEPIRKELEAFARSNGIPYSRDRRLTWAETIAAWKDHRRARGLPSPNGPPPLRERPDYTQDMGAGRPDERRLKDWSSLDDCVEHVRVYLEQLSPGERSTQRGYSDWARTRAETPKQSAFDRHGGWGRVRELALERVLSRS